MLLIAGLPMPAVRWYSPDDGLADSPWANARLRPLACSSLVEQSLTWLRPGVLQWRSANVREEVQKGALGDPIPNFVGFTIE